MTKKRLLSYLVFFLSLTALQATDCEKERLTLRLGEGTTLLQTINTLAAECRYTVIYADNKTHDLVKARRLSPIYINSQSVGKVLDLVIGQNNFHYALKNDILTISHVITKTFNVDYIDSARTGNSNIDVIISGSSVNNGMSGTSGSSYGTSGSASYSGSYGTSGTGTSGSYGGGASSGSTGAYIKTTESFDFWKDLEEDIKKILDRPEDGEEKYAAPIIVNKKSGHVIVSGTKRQLDRVQDYIDTTLSALQKQVVIDVQILGVTLDKSHTMGVDWSQFSLDFGLTGALLKSKDDTEVNGVRTLTETDSLIVDRSANLDVGGMFNFLRQFGDTRSLSNPKVLAINNQPSMISVGDNINYLIKQSTATSTTTTTIAETQIPASLFVGVLLDITPQIDEEGFITLRINPSISEFKYSEDSVKQTVTRNLPPDTVTRRISSVVRVKDGDSIILGGLISTTRGVDENKVRLLGDIPWLGWLFKSETVTDIITEIVFILTPHLSEAAKMPSLSDLGFELVTDDVNLTKKEEKSNLILPEASQTPPAEPAGETGIADAIPSVKVERQ